MLEQLKKRLQKWHPQGSRPVMVEDMTSQQLDSTIRMLTADPATARALFALRMMIELEERGETAFECLVDDRCGMDALGQN